MGTNYASDYALAQTGCGSWGNLPAQQSTPSQILAYGEQKRQLHQAVEDLPDEEREVTEMMWFHGLTQRQAAAIVEVSERTIQRRWLRARLKLFAALAGHAPLPNGHLSFVERQQPGHRDRTAVRQFGGRCRRR